MKNRILFLILSALTCTSLGAADLDSLFLNWKGLSGSGRIHAGNEMLEEGLHQDLLTDRRSFGRGQSLEADANIYDMMTYYYMCRDRYDEALAAGLTALPLCEKVKDSELLAGCLNNLGIIYQRKGLSARQYIIWKRSIRWICSQRTRAGSTLR